MTSRPGFCPLVKFRCRGVGSLHPCAVAGCRVSKMTRRISAILGVFAVLTACGGAATPEPAEPTSEAVPDTDSEPAATPEPSSEAGAEAAPATASGEANTDVAQVQEVLQLVLDDEAL